MNVYWQTKYIRQNKDRIIETFVIITKRHFYQENIDQWITKSLCAQDAGMLISVDLTLVTSRKWFPSDKLSFRWYVTCAATDVHS